MSKQKYFIRELPKDAGTGKIVTRQYALDNPYTTYIQKVKVKLRRK